MQTSLDVINRKLQALFILGFILFGFNVLSSFITTDSLMGSYTAESVILSVGGSGNFERGFIAPASCGAQGDNIHPDWGSCSPPPPPPPPSFPDLSIISLDPTGDLISGETVFVTGDIINQGSSPALQSTARWCLTDDKEACLNGSAGYLSQPTVPALGPGAIFQTPPLAYVIQSGLNTLTLCSDFGDVVSESNETSDNNCASWPFSAISVPSQCSDNEDNDGDGFVDYPADLGCGDSEDDEELAPPADITLFASPPTVTSGNTSIIEWNVLNVIGCSILGSNGDSWTGISGSEETSQVSGDIIYTLTCTDLESQTVEESIIIRLRILEFEEF